MCLVEQNKNARPLTSVSDDPDDLAVTPNHFSLSRASLATPFLSDIQRYIGLQRVTRVPQA